MLGMIKEDISSGDIVICSGIPMVGMMAGVYKTISAWCQEKVGIKNFLISTGCNRGLFFSEDLALKISVPDEPVGSTIGSGDYTIAGFCIALQKGYSLRDCLKYAMACGVCNAMRPASSNRNHRLV